MKGISDQDYEHAQQVWNRITSGHKNITLGDYHDVYLKSDTLLLVDVFETFWNTCLKHYKLDPAHFYTTGLIKDKKGAKTTNYSPTSLGLSCLQS